MALRAFTDGGGVEWQVWDIQPEPWCHGLMSTPELEGSWLVFQSPHEKRRLCPIPPDWESCPPERLSLLSRVALPAQTVAA